MKKREVSLTSEHVNAIICFLFALIALFGGILLFFDYQILQNVDNKTISEIPYVSGRILELDQHKTNLDIQIEGSEKEFYIHQKYLEGFTLNVGDTAVVHYAEANFFRGNYYEIVNLTVNEQVFFSMEEYKESNFPIVYLIISISLFTAFLVLVVVGGVFLKKPSNDSSIIKEYFKKQYNFTEEQAAEIALIRNTKAGLEEDREEIYKRFKKSIYKKDNKWYTSAMEHLKNEAYADVLYQVIADSLSDDELKVIYDDGLLDKSAIFLAFKNDGKTLINYMFNNRETNLFEIDNAYFLFPKEYEMSEGEIKKYKEKLENYNQTIEDIFKVKI